MCFTLTGHTSMYFIVTSRASKWMFAVRYPTHHAACELCRQSSGNPLPQLSSMAFLKTRSQHARCAVSMVCVLAVRILCACVHRRPHEHFLLLFTSPALSPILKQISFIILNPPTYRLPRTPKLPDSLPQTISQGWQCHDALPFTLNDLRFPGLRMVSIRHTPKLKII